MFHPGPGQSENPSQAWITELERYFSRGNNTRLPWPAGSMMVSEKHRVLYSPVAKCACTSLKTMMVNLAGLEHFFGHDVVGFVVFDCIAQELCKCASAACIVSHAKHVAVEDRPSPGKARVFEQLAYESATPIGLGHFVVVEIFAGRGDTPQQVDRRAAEECRIVAYRSWLKV